MSGCRNISVGKFCCKKTLQSLQAVSRCCGIDFCAESPCCFLQQCACARTEIPKPNFFSAGLKLPSADSTFISKEYGHALVQPVRKAVVKLPFGLTFHRIPDKIFLRQHNARCTRKEQADDVFQSSGTQRKIAAFIPYFSYICSDYCSCRRSVCPVCLCFRHRHRPDFTCTDRKYRR